MVRVGLVGCGTIGSQLAQAIEQHYSRQARIVALHDSNSAHARTLQQHLASRPPLVSISRLLRSSDFVIEAASVDVVPELVTRALRTNRSIFVMSVGGLLRAHAWQGLAARSKGRVYIPSGALAGLDGVKAIARGRIRRIALTTRKPPSALADAPYVQRRHLDLSRLRRPQVIFEGSPSAAIRAFPQNTNVAAALALASGAAASRVRIRVVADPTIRTNQHEVEVEGDCGRLSCRTESRPSANPKTSELAVRSAIVALGRVFDPISIGT